MDGLAKRQVSFLEGHALGSLLEIGGKCPFPLQAETVVGRSAHCALVLDSALVSSVHACIRFTPTGWEAKDLGSTNGTFVNGCRLLPGTVRALTSGDTITFGCQQNRWTLLDETPPCAMAVSDNGGVVVAEQNMIAIPSAMNPVVTLYCTSQGSWRIEHPGGSAPIDHGHRFEAMGQAWVALLAPGVDRTHASLAMDVRGVCLAFRVSSDEEDIELTAYVDGSAIGLGNRSSNMLLLVLARQRLEDAAMGLPEERCGWMYPDDLARALAMDVEHLNVDIFRVRRRFARHFQNAAEIIQRQSGSRRLRLTVAALEIGRD